MSHVDRNRLNKNCFKFVGDPKTKFLPLFFSAVRRPPIRPIIKNFTWHCPYPMSDVRPGANPIQMFIILLQVILLIKGAQGPIRGALKGAPSGSWRAEGGGWTTKGRGGRWTDGSFYSFLVIPNFIWRPFFLLQPTRVAKFFVNQFSICRSLMLSKVFFFCSNLAFQIKRKKCLLFLTNQF